MKILSFDQASAKTGYALYEGDKLCAHGILAVKEKDSFLRLIAMFELIAAAIEEYEPNLVIVEGVALQRSPYSLIMLAQLQGMIIGYCVKKAVDYKILATTSWRKILGFKQGPKIERKELKAQAKEKALQLIEGEKKVSEDEADAICIGYASVLTESILGGN